MKLIMCITQVSFNIPFFIMLRVQYFRFRFPCLTNSIFKKPQFCPNTYQCMVTDYGVFYLDVLVSLNYCLAMLGSMDGNDNQRVSVWTTLD